MLWQPDGAGHASARDVCRGLREYARLHYGGMSAAIEQLRALEILTGEDVGEIVYAYVTRATCT